ncbi:hypothetical protein K474DRAFT_983023 [Panus rudis PR-1116 ss-1]|nr:hypothetical protein K474DRAFT_983023 [Panus rudis PR-1116 ss-1]
MHFLKSRSRYCKGKLMNQGTRAQRLRMSMRITIHSRSLLFLTFPLIDSRRLLAVSVSVPVSVPVSVSLTSISFCPG